MTLVGGRIDLIVFGDMPASWKLGRVVQATYSIESINVALRQLLSASGDGFVFFYENSGHTLTEEIISTLNAETTHIIFGIECEFPSVLNYSVSSSYFNLRPSRTLAGYTSWLVSLKCCLVNKKVFAEWPFLDNRFETVQGATLHWAYSLLYTGVQMRFSTSFLISAFSEKAPPLNDQLRLIYFHQGRKWVIWSWIRFTMGSIVKGFSVIGFSVSLLRESQEAKWKISGYPDWRKGHVAGTPKVTILIPTVDRYAYLFKLLGQLESQTIAPHEVVVIDQTKTNRKEITAPGLPLKVLVMDQAGQCRSRNLGLQHSSGDYILFLDDDDEVYPELIEDHLKCLLYFNATISCGICHEPGAGTTPPQYRMIRMSDVFPTNNGMVKREALYKSGLFDMAYDRGQRADGDLGARLFLSGASMILNPEIDVLHHRAPQGGLRKHNVRKITFSSSRTNITHRRLPHTTELYFNKRFFSAMQQKEYKVQIVLGTFSIRGGLFKKMLKVIVSLFALPSTLIRLRERDKEANKLIDRKPDIPFLTEGKIL